jgi:fused signal recognition particle receptor|tara:strand:+ start:191 stop:1063 length:873 start_codon:yes stop_codon:yes gene_type:complete
LLKGFKDSISEIFSNRKVDQETLDKFEELLIKSDINIGTAEEIIKRLSLKRFGENFTPDDIQFSLEKIIAEILAPCEKRIKYNDPASPLVLMVMGVNGSGKTTTIAKIANNFIQEGKKVLLVAADTFRAAASEQLEEWSKKINADILKGEEGSDPASIVFKSLDESKLKESKVIIIDTAGRLHTRNDLMDQLGKINRVLKKIDENFPHETIITIDATTGQNALKQVEEFDKYVKISGIILTKYDTSASGGTLISIAEKTKLPIVAIGTGETVNDLDHFDSKRFSKDILEK